MLSTDDIIVCANCGKGEESSNDLKACAACKLVKYCNRDCQIAHRPQHKKACKKQALELHDEALFKDHPPREDCPICMLPLPIGPEAATFQSCCGKTICDGCIYMMIMEAFRRGRNKLEDHLCPYCRTPAHSSDEEEVKRLKKLMDTGNAMAYYQLGSIIVFKYAQGGTNSMRQDWEKANELWLKAGELGCATGYHNLGVNYDNGNDVEIDKEKAKYYYELAAMNGDVYARHNLGVIEGMAGNNHQRAMKHFMLAAKSGYKECLDSVKIGFMKGFVTKDEYEQTLRAYHNCASEIKSEARDKALAARNW